MSIHARQILIPIHIVWVVLLISTMMFGNITNSNIVFGILWWILLSGVGIAVGFHRYFSHQAFIAKGWAHKLMLICGSLAGQGSAIFWVALHIGYHHPHSDKEKDIHSPIHGKWSSYMGWMFKLKPSDVNLRYAIKLLRDPLAKKIHDNYNLWFWISYFAICALAFAVSSVGAAFIIFTALLVSIHQECLVNLINHSPKFGYVNYDTKDHSRNNLLTGWLCFGQGHHNNHHKFPARANFGIRWFEFDPTRLIIPLLKL